MIEVVCPSGFAFEAREWRMSDMVGFAKHVRGGALTSSAVARALRAAWERTTAPGPYPFTQTENGGGAPNFLGMIKEDILWSLFRMRAGSFPDDVEMGFTGDDYIYEVRCRNKDGHPNGGDNTFFWKEKLSDIPYIALPETSREIILSNASFEATVDGTTVRYRIATPALDDEVDEFRKERARKQAKAKSSQIADPSRDDEEGMEYLAARLTFVAGLKDQSMVKRVEWVKNLPVRHGLALRETIGASDAHINFEVTPTCPLCSLDLPMRLPITPEFFGTPDPFVKARMRAQFMAGRTLSSTC